jgi:CBS domain containing-hemolysin-like protein
MPKINNKVLAIEVNRLMNGDKSFFHMSDQTAYSLMTPRTQMMWIDLEDSLEVNLKFIQEHNNMMIKVLMIREIGSI